MNNIGQTSEVQTPLQQVLVRASIAAFACLALLYCLARPAVGLLESRMAELLVYSIIPVTIIFVFLYRSCWHREITGVLRTCSLFGLSFLVFACELIVILFLFGIAMFCLMALSGGNH